MNDQDKLFEQLAAIEHERWADWQKYMHGQCVGHDAEWVLLPRISFDHWERQIETVYGNLTEREKQSDRDQVKRYWRLITPLFAEIKRLRKVMQEKNDALSEAWATIRSINEDNPDVDL